MSYHRGMRLVFPWILVLFTGLAHGLVLREDIGELKIHDLLIRPNFMLKEPHNGAFSVGESSFALRWELEHTYAGVVRVGPKTLMNPLARYTATVEEDIMLVEAYAEIYGAYGRARLGRLPIGFGHEGEQWERQLIFPRSLLFQRRLMMLRDVGFSYEIEHNRFYTGMTVHNGESDTDKDGRVWYTARWGYRTERFDVGFSGQTGSTKPTATSASTDTFAGVDPLKEAKWRMGGLFASMNYAKWDWVIEAYLGEREQEKQVVKYSTGHTDLSHQFTDEFSAHIRYDFLDPNNTVKTDLERQVSLALVLSNKTHSSNIILVGTKVLEQAGQVNNDELRLIWSLSPSGIVRF